MDILNLPCLKTLQTRETDTDWYIAAETVARPSPCPRCQASNPRLTGHGRRQQIFQDIPVNGKRACILIERRRYTCRECGSTFLERLLDMDDRRNITKRLLRHIQVQALTGTFASLAREIGLSEKTIRLIFQDYISEQLRSYQPEAPRWLGIDEAYLRGGYRCVLGNIELSTMLDILQNRSRTTVANYLSRLAGRERVEFVSMGMWPPYREAVNCSLPNAKIIIDHCQIIDCVNNAVVAASRSIQEDLTPKERQALAHRRLLLAKPCSDLAPPEHRSLENLLRHLPLLKLAYGLKEEFCDIFTASLSRVEAEQRYDRWALRIVPDLKQFFGILITSMNNWRTEIFNYFDVPGYAVTAAYRESLAGLIERLNRTGRSHSFQALRARMLLTAPAEIGDLAPGRSLEGIERQSGILGVHIPTLLKKLESNDWPV
jgi:transposase